MVFTSDNGATKEGSNLPFRDGKHSVFEGGTRLPTVIHWPAGKLAGRRWAGLCGALDMFPTLIAMAGLEMPSTRPLDGKNIWPALRDTTASPVESYYWVWRNEDAIRTAQWRMHRYFDRVELYDINTDAGETRNVAGNHADVVKSLTTKMNAWQESLGAALSHQPAPATIAGKPSPEGEVLEITVTVTSDAKPKDTLIVPFASLTGHHEATDYIEFDIATGKDSLQTGFYFSPFKGNENKSYVLEFTRGKAVDQFGRDQSTGPATKGGPGVWERRVMGLCGSAPGILPRHALVFRGGKPGTYKIYLDNLRIRHANGKTTPIWTSSKNTRMTAIDKGQLFSEVTIRSVDVAQVDK